MAFVSRHRFAGAVSPIGMVMGGDGPACFQPLDHSFVPALPVNDLSSDELDIDELSRAPWWTRDDLRESGTTWYSADQKGMAALLRFAADQGHLAEAADSAPALRGADDAVSWVEELLARRSPRWLMGWRDICRNTDERTLIATVLTRAAVNHLLPLMFVARAPAQQVAVLVGGTSTHCLDYIARQKTGGTHLTYFIVRQLPVMGRTSFMGSDLDFIVPRVLELTYTAWDLQPFAQDCGWDGPPFRWDEERRFLLRAELDAAFFHLYLPSTSDGEWRLAREAEGARVDETEAQLASLREHFPTPRDAVDYILETFPIVRRKDEQKHGEYHARSASSWRCGTRCRPRWRTASVTGRRSIRRQPTRAAVIRRGSDRRDGGPDVARRGRRGCAGSRTPPTLHAPRPWCRTRLVCWEPNEPGRERAG